jgi:hypothetical protein
MYIYTYIFTNIYIYIHIYIFTHIIINTVMDPCGVSERAPRPEEGRRKGRKEGKGGGGRS